MLLSFLPAAAYDFEVDGIYYNVLSDTDGTCSVAKASDQIKGIFEIPSKVKHEGRIFTVNEIEAYAFSNNFDITTITIPNSVSKFYPNTFNGNLKELIIADGDSSISFEMTESQSPLYYGRPMSEGASIFKWHYCPSYIGLIAPNIEKLYLGRELSYGRSAPLGTAIYIYSPIPNSVKVLSLGPTVSHIENGYWVLSGSIRYYASVQDCTNNKLTTLYLYHDKYSIIPDSLEEIRILNQTPPKQRKKSLREAFKSAQYKQIKLLLLYNPQNEMFALLKTRRSFLKNEA